MSQNSSGNRNVTGRVSELPSSNKATPAKSSANKNDASSSDAKNDSVIQDESGVTYRVVHLPSDFFQTSPAGATSQNLIAPAADVSGAGDSNGQQQQQPLLLNVSSLGTTPTLAIASTASQVQLQTIDNGAAGQQYYIMIPSGDLLPGVSSSGAGSQTTRGQSRKSSQSGKSDQSAGSVAAAIQQAVGSSVDPSQPMVTAFIQENEGPALPHKEIRRRVSHNEVEKRRRDKINNWINKLARLVPAAAEESCKHAQSKGGVLAKTVDYIHELKSISADVQKLRAQVRDLARENKVLKQKLNEHGVPVPSVPKSTSPSQQVGANRGQTQGPISIAPKGRIIPVNLASAGTVLLLSQDATTGAFSLTQPVQSPDIEDESMEMQL